MTEMVYRGVVVPIKGSKYFQAVEGKSNSLTYLNSTAKLTYTPGSTALDLALSLDLKTIGTGDLEMLPSGSPQKIKPVKVTLNGLTLEKQTWDSHIISIVIVRDSESRVVQDYWRTTIVVSEEDAKDQKFIQFLFYSGNLLFLKPVGPRLGCWALMNFPKLIIGDSDLNIDSSNSAAYTLRKRYNDYVIREIDYQDQLIVELRRILHEYGIELVRINKESTLSSTTYATYQINQTPVPQSHPYRRDGERNILNYKQPIEFVLHTTDMVLFHDFKNKYINVDLLTNFCEFKTTDKYGERWTAAIKWGQITEDFNHVYQPDDNSNFSYQCQFRCEMFYYEVLDTRYEFLNEITTVLDSERIDGKVEQTEQIQI